MHAHGGHGHRHAHGPVGPQGPAGGDPAERRRNDRRRLALTLGLAGSYMVAEVVGGWLSGSLALLADAGHMLSDVAALAVALFALWIAQRPADARRTFGHTRAEILAALGQGAALVCVAFVVVHEALERLSQPHPVEAPLMLAVATGGLAINLAGLWILEGGRGHSLNVRGAWLHVLSDALGSAGAIAAGLAIWLWNVSWADPVASLAIAVLIVFSAWNLLKEAIDVLMETVPAHLDVEEIRTTLREVEGVEEVHDLHVWTIGSGEVSLSAHVVSTFEGPAPELLSRLHDVLLERFGIDHSTLQIEPPGFNETGAHVDGVACDPPRAASGRA
jgi:cobalt-zinc-cadmium efflux system protein